VEAERVGIHGAATTPFLLGSVLRATEGRSLSANLGLLEENAFLAGAIAVALSERRKRLAKEEKL
jgi:pseudouridine-5'-phosphate glycosidase